MPRSMVISEITDDPDLTNEARARELIKLVDTWPADDLGSPLAMAAAQTFATLAVADALREGLAPTPGAGYSIAQAVAAAGGIEG